MDASLTSLSKIFTEKLFRIPDYQRGYAWTNKEVAEFWNDLIHLEHDKNHYLGVLTLEDAPQKNIDLWIEDHWIIRSKKYAAYYIVDGQQRITTVILLIQAILEIISAHGADTELNYTSIDDIRRKFIFDKKTDTASRSYLFGYDKDNPSYEYLKREIFCEQSNNAGPLENTIYTQNLFAAKNYFKERLEKLPLSEIEEIYTKITQCFLFNIYSLDAEIDTYVAFETMNNRGKVLSQLELLKNRLIYLTTKLPQDDFYKESLRHSINECWKSMYHFLGKDIKNRLNDDDFLRHHYFLYFNEATPENDDSEYIYHDYIMFGEYDEDRVLIDHIFSAKPLNDKSRPHEVTAEFISKYVSSLKQSVETWYNIHNPLASNYHADIKEWLSRCNKLNAWKGARTLMLELLNGKFDTSKTVTALSLIERSLFISSFLSLDQYLRAVNYTQKSLILKKTHDLDQLISDIKKDTEKVLAPAILGFNLKFKDSDFYNWKGIRYFLYDYEYNIQRASKTSREKLDWEEFNKREKDSDYITVEHIYPQRARHPEWVKNFESYTPKQRKKFRHTLGNLVPLSKRKNSSLSNRTFNEKKTFGFRFGCFSENEICNLNEWGPKEIKDRTCTLLAYMDKRWELGLCPQHILKDKDKTKAQKHYLSLVELDI